MGNKRSEDPPRTRAHRRLLYKILTSVASFTVTFAVSALLPDGQRPEVVWNIGVSLFVAGVVFVAQYLFDVERRLATLDQNVERRLAALEQHFDEFRRRTGTDLSRYAEATREQLTDGFSKIHLATELFGLREASQLKPDEMTEITKLVRNRTKITSDATELVQDFAQNEITRLAEYLKQIGDGSDLTYEGEDRDWLLGLTKVARTSIQATSLSSVDAGGKSFIAGGLWRTDLGQRYLDLQREAIKRKVTVQRLFIIDREGVRPEEVADVLRQQLEIGVQVKILDATVASTFHPRLRDFVVFDGVLSYQTAASTVGRLDPMVVNTSVVTHRERVIRRIGEFNDLWTAPDARRVTLDAHRKVVLPPLPGDDDAGGPGPSDRHRGRR
ncbi:hypothetical protein [Micromonospora zhanjiangensis]|uniref:Phosphatidylserine/phosphatidylglycerophosphate/ cardiolipin synthase family protein n=1 Tax=Micromonospora zhanjiangensis TaxID=1522057 RepID=A0ABV8KKV6_9ACTN